MKYLAETKITYLDETKTVKEWAAQNGMSTRALRQRLERIAKRGDIGHEQLQRVLVPVLDNEGLGVRTRLVHRLLHAVEKYGQHTIDTEVKAYIAEKGVLSFYKEFGSFFPKNPSVRLDGANSDATAKPATMVVFNQSQPSPTFIRNKHEQLEDDDL